MEELFNVILTMHGRVNFMNLARYSHLCERTFRRWFLRPFGFVNLNHEIINHLPKGEYIVAMDGVIQTKSGKKTFGVGTFWSTIQKRTVRAIESSSIALVHLGLNQAFSLDNRQTNGKVKKTVSRMDQYVAHLKDRTSDILKYTTYIVVDGFYAKQKFIAQALKGKLNVISRLRIDANMQFLFEGTQKRSQGRRKRFDGKFNLQNIDRLTLVKKEKEKRIYEGLVYNMTLKQIIKIVVIIGKKGDAVMLFSTDCNLQAQKIMEYYSARFQIELLFRDAKQHAGFGQCQSRNKNALNFHFNTTMTTVNFAKLEILQKNGFDPSISLSIDNFKRKRFNEYFIELIISMLGINPNLIVSNINYQNIINYGTLAA